MNNLLDLNEIVYFADGTIKSLTQNGVGVVGEYSVIWGDASRKDFHGNFFTKNTFLGHNQGNNSVAFINHRVPLFKSGQFDAATEKALRDIADMRMKAPIQTTVDAVGVFSTLVLDLSDKYEKMVYDLTAKGAFKWSSGTSPQAYKALPSGELEMFVITEQSLTPIPAEHRMLSHRVMPLKSYTDFLNDDQQFPAQLDLYLRSMKPQALTDYFQSYLSGS